MIADALYVGGTTVDRVMLGDVEVWSAAPALPVVTITGTSGNTSRDQFLQACIDYGTTFDTVEVLPFRLDTSQATSMNSMFEGCSSLAQLPDLDTANVTDMGRMFRNCSLLTRVPDLDTGNVTDMGRMFQNCSLLTRVPDLDTGNVTDMSNMFRGCLALTHVPDMDTRSVTNMSYMFRDCASLTDGNVRLIGKHPDVNTQTMISGAGLTREPFYDTAGNPI